MCHVPDHGQISGWVIRPDPAFIVAECHIHHPMQTVLYAPVVADCRSDETRRCSSGGDERVSFSVFPLIWRVLSTTATAFSPASHAGG